MCGIFAFIKLLKNNAIADYQKEKILNSFMTIKHRGPDSTKYEFFDNSVDQYNSLSRHECWANYYNKITTKNKYHNKKTFDIFMGFHRLAINDLSELGDQPFKSSNGEVTLICNGEIYNYKELINKFNITLKSTSDCEVILHMYQKIGFNETIKLLDGVFACVLYDRSNNIVYAARDPIGIRSLYIGENEDGNYGFCSELKGISDILDNIKQFKPGHTWNSDNKQYSEYKHCKVSELSYMPIYPTNDINVLRQNIRTLLTNSVKKRLMADRPIGCLLSGGIDSSIVAALISRELKTNRLKTFSVGLADSTDLKYARMVANHINSEHHELILTESELLNGIEDTIRQFETWDVTTIRAGVPMYLLAKYIKANFDTTVIMSGEAADEASGSYLYFKNAPDNESFQRESVRLMNDLSYYDVLRVDKSISGAGLECRIPFIDNDFLNFYMNIDPKFKNHNFCELTYNQNNSYNEESDKLIDSIKKLINGTSNTGIEKYLLRSSFEDENLLPKEVLWRRKEAFSDGVSSNKRSWYTIIQEYANRIYTNDIYIKKIKELTIKNENPIPYSKESLLFREIFNKYYPNNVNTIPYYWVPKFMGDIMEPSARVLNVY